MAKKSNVIAKGDHCASCYFFLECKADPDDEEGIIVMCSRELNGVVDKTGELDECPQYQVVAERRDMTLEDMIELVDEGGEEMEEPTYEEALKPYVFRGDVLVEVETLRPGMEPKYLTPSFVDTYNMAVTGHKKEIMDDINRMQGQLTLWMQAAKDKLDQAYAEVETSEDGKPIPAGVGGLDLNMILGLESENETVWECTECGEQYEEKPETCQNEECGGTEFNEVEVETEELEDDEEDLDEDEDEDWEEEDDDLDDELDIFEDEDEDDDDA